MKRKLTEIFGFYDGRSRCLFGVVVMLLLSCAGLQGAVWETMKHGGQDYVTLRSVKNFYFFDKITYGKQIVLYRKAKIAGGETHKEVEIKFSSGSKRCDMNGVLFILSHAIVKKNGRYLLSRIDLVKLMDPVLRPYRIDKARPFRTVVLDPGHGGHDSGARGYFGVHEKFYALKVARMVRDGLQKKGFRVVMTRDSDVFVSLANRVKIANKYPNAIFVSIHFNSGGNRLANGIETFTISPVGVPHMGRGIRDRDFRKVPGNLMGTASIALATAVHSRTVRFLNDRRFGNDFNVADRGIKRARFNVLTGIRIPAILLEGGFLSNRTEARKVHTQAYQQTMAYAVVEAVRVYHKSIGGR